MAEIGIVASIIGVAQMGCRLSMVLNAFGLDIANAPEEIQNISNGVTIFSSMLKQVAYTLQEAESVASPEALKTARQVSDECVKVFNEIDGMVDKVRGKSKSGDGTPTVPQRLRWCFKKHRAVYLLAQLESLKMNLLVILQILQLGKIMASTSKSDSPEEVNTKSAEIASERLETQNAIIVKYCQDTRLPDYREAAEKEVKEDYTAEIEESSQVPLRNGKPQLTIEAPPDYDCSKALIEVSTISLGEFDSSLERMRQSPKDMVQVSDQVIDPLLNSWTRWRDIRERRDARKSGTSARYAPSVQALYESDEERRWDEDIHDRVESPGALLLEGTTTDWRQPHSADARRDARRLRQRYRGYQPSVTVDSSEAEGSPPIREPKKQHPPRRYVLDSGAESSSESEPKLPRPRRRSSGSPTTEKKIRFPDSTPMSHSYTPNQTFGGRYNSSSSPYGTPQSTPRSSSSIPRSPIGGRPGPAPNQSHPYQHSFTTPMPPPPTSNPPNPYAHSSSYAPSVPPPPFPGPNGQHHNTSRHLPPQPQYMLNPPKPGSQDGSGRRSPSRQSLQGPTSSRDFADEEKRREKSRKSKNFNRTATKSILGAGAIAAFLEALEGLDI